MVAKLLLLVPRVCYYSRLLGSQFVACQGVAMPLLGCSTWFSQFRFKCSCIGYFSPISRELSCRFSAVSIWFLELLWGVARLLLLVSRCCSGGFQVLLCISQSVLFGFLESCHVVAGCSVWFPGAAMQLLGYSGQFPGSCYVVARVFWVCVFPKKHRQQTMVVISLNHIVTT